MDREFLWGHAGQNYEFEYKNGEVRKTKELKRSQVYALLAAASIFGTYFIYMAYTQFKMLVI